MEHKGLFEKRKTTPDYVLSGDLQDLGRAVEVERRQEVPETVSKKEAQAHLPIVSSKATFMEDPSGGIARKLWTSKSLVPTEPQVGDI